MNTFIRNIIYFGTGILKVSFTKIFHLSNFNASLYSVIAPSAEITIGAKGKLKIGSRFRMRDHGKIRVRNGGVCCIGNNTFINTNTIITCHERIEIGDNVQIAPNVQIYDQDHDYRADGGVNAQKYKTSPVVIGNDVWIGANTVILRGTTIGDHCVIGAGSVIKGNFPANTVVLQKRETEYFCYKTDETE